MAPDDSVVVFGVVVVVVGAVEVTVGGEAGEADGLTVGAAPTIGNVGTIPMEGKEP
jgi:hypothetical protein